MSDLDILEKARHLVDNCKLSGAALEFCERLIADGPSDIMSDDEDEAYEAINERRKIRELCTLYGIA